MGGGFGRIPGVKSITLTPLQVRLSDLGVGLALSAVIDSALTDSGSTPTSRIRPGQVVCKDATTGRWYAANNSSNGTRSAQGSITSTIAIGTGSASKAFFWTYKGGMAQTVTGAVGDDTTAEWVTLLNADPDFSADLIADATGAASGFLRIKTKRAGVLEYFQIQNGSLNDQGTVDQDTFTDYTDVAGTDGAYAVMEDFFDLVDTNNAAVHGFGVVYPVGHWNSTNLRNLTAEARCVLRENGSMFEAL